MPHGDQLTQEQVLHLAKLARLELTPQEVEQFTRQLGEVITYVAKLQELKAASSDTTEAEPVVPRVDEVKPWPETSKLIASAPQHSDNLIEVPEVFSERE